MERGDNYLITYHNMDNKKILAMFLEEYNGMYLFKNMHGEFAVNRHIFTGRATRQFEVDFVNYPTDKLESLIKKCLNGDRCNDGIIKTVKRIISK